MIIADSNMSMSSRRLYSQKVSSDMVAAGSSGNSFSFGMSQARSSLSQKESYFSNSSDSPDRKYDDMFLMMPLYNRSGRLNVPDDSSKTDLAGEESPEGTEALTPAYNKASLVSMRQNVSFSYTEITRKVYMSLLDFIQSLSFRGMFHDTDSLSCNSVSDTSSSDKASKTLSITNQISPTVWTVRTRYSSTYEEKEALHFQQPELLKQQTAGNLILILI